MKTFICVILLLILSNNVSIASNPPKISHHVHIISTSLDVFYFKIDHHYIGALVEIYNADSVMIWTHKMKHRKIIIDFFEVPAGDYVIKFTKHDKTEEFPFRKTSSHEDIKNEITFHEVSSFSKGCPCDSHHAPDSHHTAQNTPATEETTTP